MPFLVTTWLDLWRHVKNWTSCNILVGKDSTKIQDASKIQLKIKSIKIRLLLWIMWINSEYIRNFWWSSTFFSKHRCEAYIIAKGIIFNDFFKKNSYHNEYFEKKDLMIFLFVWHFLIFRNIRIVTVWPSISFML